MTFELSDNFATDDVDHLDGKVRKSDGEKGAGSVKLHLEDGRLHLQVFPELNVGGEPPKPEEAFAVPGDDRLKEINSLEGKLRRAPSVQDGCTGFR